jgi:dTDP-glucose 4,6-dehydratase
MNVLVTGGAGFIGSHLVRRLIMQSGHRVVNLDALRYSGNRANTRDLDGHAAYRFVHGDIADQALVRRVFEEH